MYTILKDKLKNLKPGDLIPIEMVKEYREDLFDCTEARIVKWSNPLERDSIREDPYLHLELTLKRYGAKQTDCIRASSFYCEQVLREKYRNKYFHDLKVGKLAIVAEQCISGLTASMLLTDNVQVHQNMGFTLEEGTLVLVLQLIQLDEYPLVKILYGEEVFWTYGVLFDKNYFEVNDNDNHWI